MISANVARRVRLAVVVMAAFCAVSCSRLGWGVLLWSTDDPPIPSGTVLPVYIKSNIDRLWVVGVPEDYRGSLARGAKIEVPMWQFEFIGNKKKAEMRAREFAEYSHVYAENLQDGLPVRDSPDNGGRRVYRLRVGETVKILSLAEGNPPISATGDPLPGEWYRVLTEAGNIGYCFSYRLKLFDHDSGPLDTLPSLTEEVIDSDLDMVLSQTWSPESYSAMINNNRINLDDLSKRWRFEPGQDTGVAHIYISDLERTFSYNRIRPDGYRAWQFEGTSLQMNLRSETSLAVRFVERNGAQRTLLFTVLPSEIRDIIIQETARRDGLFRTMYAQGPVFTSNNYGTITFTPDRRFTWTDYELLVPHIISSNTEGKGTVAMDIFLSDELVERYNGAFSLRFSGVTEPLRFLYTLDSQGFRLEHVPESSMDEITVIRQASSPTVLYFYKDNNPLGLPSGLPSGITED